MKMTDLKPSKAKVLWEHKGKSELLEVNNDLNEMWKRAKNCLEQIAERVSERDTCKAKADHLSTLFLLIEGLEDDRRKLHGLRDRALKAEEV